jgi:hypothetical protein
MKGWLANDELKRIWNEAVVAQFKVKSQHLPGGTEKTHKNFIYDNPSPGRDLNPGPSEYEAGVFTNQPRRSVPHCISKYSNIMVTVITVTYFTDAYQ